MHQNQGLSEGCPLYNNAMSRDSTTPSTHLNPHPLKSPLLKLPKLKPTMPQLQLLSTLPGHTEPAWSVAFNPTRSLLASCSTDKTVRLYSYILPQPSSSSSSSSASTYPKPDDPRPTFSLSNVITTKHKRTVRSIAWAPSGRTLATASFDSSVGVWEEVDPESLETDEAEGVFWPGSGDGDEVGRSGGGGGGGKEWECITTLEGHDSECKSVGFSSDGGLLASCSRDTSVWVWEGEC